MNACWTGLSDCCPFRQQRFKLFNNEFEAFVTWLSKKNLATKCGLRLLTIHPGSNTPTLSQKFEYDKRKRKTCDVFVVPTHKNRLVFSAPKVKYKQFRHFKVPSLSISNLTLLSSLLHAVSNEIIPGASD